MTRIGMAGRIVLTVVSIPIGAILILFGVLLALSPGRPRPFTDRDGRALAGSISEKTHVLINGA